MIHFNLTLRSAVNNFILKKNRKINNTYIFHYNNQSTLNGVYKHFYVPFKVYNSDFPFLSFI